MNSFWSVWSRAPVLPMQQVPEISYGVWVVIAGFLLLALHEAALIITPSHTRYRLARRVQLGSTLGLLVVAASAFFVLPFAGDLRSTFTVTYGEKVLFIGAGIFIAVFVGMLSRRFVFGGWHMGKILLSQPPRRWVANSILVLSLLLMVADVGSVVLVRGYYLHHGVTFTGASQLLSTVFGLRAAWFLCAIGLLAGFVIIHSNQRYIRLLYMKNGLCTTCGYKHELHAGKLCSECGTVIPTS